MNTTTSCFSFGPYTLTPDERLLVREGQAVALPPKAFELLSVFVASEG